MPHNFLLITADESGAWPGVLREALRPLGSLQVVSRPEIWERLASCHCQAIVIVDALEPEHLPTLLSRLKEQCPQLVVLVATASPTWSRAREAFRYGAADYVRKSLDREEMLAAVRGALNRLGVEPSSCGAGQEECHV